MFEDKGLATYRECSVEEVEVEEIEGVDTAASGEAGDVCFWEIPPPLVWESVTLSKKRDYSLGWMVMVSLEVEMPVAD